MSLVDRARLGPSSGEKLRAAEEAIYEDQDDPSVNWDESALAAVLECGRLRGRERRGRGNRGRNPHPAGDARPLVWHGALARRRDASYRQRLAQSR